MAGPRHLHPEEIDNGTCVICHDEADVTVEIHDPSFDSGRLLADVCVPHLREGFEYLLSVEAPRRGWHEGVTRHAS